MMTGGISEIPPEKLSKHDYPEIQTGVEMYMDELNEESATVYKPICIRASRQVIQGTMFRVGMEAVQVDVDVANNYCTAVAQGDKNFICIGVWSRPWMQESERLLVEKRNAEDFNSCLEVYNK